MKPTNPFLKVREFSSIVDNPFNLSIFLSIAKNSRRTYTELMEEFNKVKEVADSINILQKGDLIEGNPNPISERFKLSFNGQVFAEQLKTEFPEVKNLLGDENLIKPLSIF